MTPGLFIVLEGPDGAGKSTVSRFVARALDDNGYRTIRHVEPTDGPIGKLVRAAQRSEFHLDSRTLALLFAADRQEHSLAIREQRDAGWIVLCDRYALSTAIYQGAASDDVERARWAGQLSSQCQRPDLTIVLRAPIEVCAERLRRRGSPRDIFEAETMQRRVHDAYAHADRYPWGETVRWVDASGEPEAVAAAVMAVIEAEIKRRDAHA